MNPGGDAAEQVVRLSLEGVEVAAKISGNGAKNIALLLYATLKQEQKTKGKARLTSMLKSGKELKVYTITQKDLAKFSQEAKRYGVLYCVLKDRKNTDPNAAVDVIARAEDASKIQRITERFKLATVNRADVSLDIRRDKMFPKDKSVKEALRGGSAADEHSPAAGERTMNVDERSDSADESVQPDPERGLPPAYDVEPREGQRIMDDPKKEEPQINPSLAKTDRDHLSEPSSTQASPSNGFLGKTERPSVREKLNVYKAEIARTKAEKARELAKDVVSKGLDAARDAAKAVPIPKVPGRDR
ncbi:MAG: PcfB family protein [Mogibacterium sp.]|nr:PcfB family protein [Mogibacterium sp.]MBR4089801.1 PcfB family protein [Mogibacterium sp.]